MNGSSLRVCLNGRILALRDARVSVFDRGFLFGDGVYETIRIYSGFPFRLEAHLARLRQSAGRLGFKLPYGNRVWRNFLMRTIRANSFKEARARFVVTRGEGIPDLHARGKFRPNFLIYVNPFVPPSAEERRKGIPVVFSEILRNERKGLDPAIKSLNLLNNLLARQDALRRKARDAIMLNAGGMVTEATNANVFFVKRGVLCTPVLASGILAGITRGIVLDLARRLGFPIREELFRSQAFLRADEVFLTASTIEILPVSRLDGRRFAPALPYTRVLQKAYRITVDDEIKLQSGS